VALIVAQSAFFQPRVRGVMVKSAADNYRVTGVILNPGEE